MVNFRTESDKTPMENSISNGITPKHIAAGKNSVEYMEQMKQGGMDIEVLTDTGFTPMHFAAMILNSAVGERQYSGKLLMLSQ